MKPTRPARSLPVLLLLLLLPACSQLPFGASPPQVPNPTAPPTETPLPPPPVQVAEVTFRVTIPDNTPADGAIELSVLDEVTGLALNPVHYTMTAESEHIYSITLQFPVGGVIKYRYSRAAHIRAIEHTSGGAPVRYRLIEISASGFVHDLVSRWNDTQFSGPTGRLTGRITDSATGAPIPNLLIAAGGQQTLSRWDGTYLLEGLPPGTHNLVAYALDGTYRTFQQGAVIAAAAATAAEFAMTPAPLVTVTFYASVPEDHIPGTAVRLAGSLHQLGNLFADLPGGISTPAARLPALQYHAEGYYLLTTQLPAGAYINYKYTLGDGFWNMETTPEGDPVIRNLLIPEFDVVVNDHIANWGSRGGRAPVWFTTFSPPETGSGDTLWLQLNPWGWTQPLPMWQTGPNKWVYLLTSPLHLLGEVQFRYCRNAQCAAAAETGAVDTRSFTPGEAFLPLEGQVAQWAQYAPLTGEAPAPQVGVIPREAGFTRGIQLLDEYDPSWLAFAPQCFAGIARIGANTALLTPTWTYTRPAPPVLEALPGRDAAWLDVMDFAGAAQAAGLVVTLVPGARFPEGAAAFWESAPRDYAWWANWFEQYGYFAQHHAALAAQTQAGALALGGGWLAPALPGGSMPDGFTSGVPLEAEDWWRAILADVRAGYGGALAWNLPLSAAGAPPPFLDAVDAIYILWDEPLADRADRSTAEMAEQAGRLIDERLVPLYLRFNKPIVIAAAFPSTGASGGLDMDAQVRLYEALLQAVNGRDWLAGFVSAGYYPPAAVQDASPSIHGKPAEILLTAWFSGFLLGNLDK
jgi:hypothetical protein